MASALLPELQNINLNRQIVSSACSSILWITVRKVQNFAFMFSFGVIINEE